MKSVPNPCRNKACHFASEQESARKDVEQPFGVLQQRFAIVRYPALTWSNEQMWEVMNCCVILHIMIIKSERHNPVHDHMPYDFEGPHAEVDHNVPTEFADYISIHLEICDENTHNSLQADLAEHLWARRSMATVEEDEENV